MFRRIENTLDPDPSFPADLKELGFFINSLGDIRMIDAPEKSYVFHATNNDRVNEVRREAMQTCQREEAEKRLYYLGLNRIHLPGFTMSKPDGPHVPILAPPPEILKTRKRVIVLVNDTMQDLGILAYRQLQRELGINGGSVVNFVKEMIKRSATDHDAEKNADIFKDGYVLEDKTTTPALIVLNTGQLLYSHKYNRAMTLRSWSAMPRKSVSHDMVRIHDEENRVPGHTNAKDHVKTVFDQVICNPDCVPVDAEVYVIAIEDGTESVLDLLTDDFLKYGTRITAMALIHSLTDASQIKDPRIRTFLHQRTRQWRFSDVTSDPAHCTDLPPPATTDDQEKEEEEEPTEWSSGQSVPCPTFSGGPDSVGECIFTCPAVQAAILSFFDDVAKDPSDYRNPSFKIYTEAPHPSPDNPLALYPNNDDTETTTFKSTSPSPGPTPEQEELEEARDLLSSLNLSLSACPFPTAMPEVRKGRAKLEKKIAVQQTRVAELEAEALLHRHGGLGTEQAEEVRQGARDWDMAVEGPKVPFAGTMVDKELLVAAGLLESEDAEEGVGRGGAVQGQNGEEGGVDEEKAFV